MKTCFAFMFTLFFPLYMSAQTSDTTVCRNYNVPGFSDCFDASYSATIWISGPNCPPDTKRELSYQYWLTNNTDGGTIFLPDPWEYLNRTGENYQFPINGSTQYTYCVNLKSNLPACTVVDVLKPDFSYTTPGVYIRHYNQPLSEASNFCADSEPLSGTVSVVADGTKSSTMKLSSACFDLSEIEVSFEEDPGGNPDKYGTFKVLSQTQTELWIQYTHPKYIETDQAYETWNMQVRDNSIGGEVIREIPFKVYRPPVVMVHGLWANRESFKKMEDALIYSGAYTKIQLFRADYEATNDFPFFDNLDVVPKAIEEALCQLQAAGIAAGKVDVVAHSMGGLLTRLHLQGVGPYTSTRIRRFIALNTPFSGAQPANLLLDAGPDELGRDINNVLCNHLLPWPTRLLNTSCYDNGAIADLAVDGSMIRLLNETNLGIEQRVPSHSIATTISNPAQFARDFLTNETATVFGLGSFIPLPKNWINQIARDLFRQEANDGVVSLSSQSGGLSGEQLSLIEEVDHVTSTSNPEVIDRVITLLKADLNNSFFTTSGFSPIPQEYALPDFFTPNSNNQRQLSLSAAVPSIQILSPTAATVVKPGDLLNIEYSGANLHTVVGLISKGQDSLYRTALDASSGSFPFTVDTTFGRRELLLIGYDTINKSLAFDTTHLFVVPDAPPLSISVSPFNMVMRQGEIKALSVIADFGTFQADVSNAPGLQIFFRRGKAQRVDNSALIQANEIGPELVSISYEGAPSLSGLEIRPDPECLYPEIFVAKVNPVSGGAYYATDSISAYTSIARDSSVQLTAGKTVSLFPGFHAQQGSSFYAGIEACPTETSPGLPPSFSLPAIDDPSDQLSVSGGTMEIFPNPAGDYVLVKLSIPSSSSFNLVLYDLNGRMLKRLPDSDKVDLGEQIYQFDTYDLQSGVYMLKLEFPGFQLIRKLVKL